MYKIVKSKEKFSLKFIKKIQKLKVIGWKAEGIQSKYIKSKNKDSKKNKKILFSAKEVKHKVHMVYNFISLELTETDIQ